MKNKKILSVAIATTLGVASLVGVTTAYDSFNVLKNWDLKVCGTEYISNNGGAQWCITIQGKNVWASTTWAWQDAPVESYGNYYQWWDNTPHFYDCSNWNRYDGWELYYQPNNAWWWENDNDWLVYPVTNGNNRQWPCDPWYHVPSQWERYALMDMWAGESVNWYIWSDASQFYTDFQIPVADRIFDDGYLDFCDSSSVFLWSSSPLSYDSLLVRSLNGYDDDPRSVGKVWATWDSSPVDKNSGLPVRCFKNYDPNENGDSGSGSASTHVTLTLTAWSNTCTLNDYNLGTHDASAEEQYIESSWQEILCEFLQNTWVRVLLSMGDLSDWSKLIWAENFTWVVTAIGNSLWSISNLTWWNYNLSWSQEIYRKAVNTLWKWTWDLQIIWTIPAWTPSGTYTWSLEIVIQEG